MRSSVRSWAHCRPCGAILGARGRRRADAHPTARLRPRRDTPLRGSRFARPDVAAEAGRHPQGGPDPGRTGDVAPRPRAGRRARPGLRAGGAVGHRARGRAGGAARRPDGLRSSRAAPPARDRSALSRRAFAAEPLGVRRAHGRHPAAADHVSRRRPRPSDPGPPAGGGRTGTGRPAPSPRAPGLAASHQRGLPPRRNRRPAGARAPGGRAPRPADRRGVRPQPGPCLRDPGRGPRLRALDRRDDHGPRARRSGRCADRRPAPALDRPPGPSPASSGATTAAWSSYWSPSAASASACCGSFSWRARRPPDGPVASSPSAGREHGLRGWGGGRHPKRGRRFHSAPACFVVARMSKATRNRFATLTTPATTGGRIPSARSSSSTSPVP